MTGFMRAALTLDVEHPAAGRGYAVRAMTVLALETADGPEIVRFKIGRAAIYLPVCSSTHGQVMSCLPSPSGAL
jgi:hypothetical protein